jgi:hypothetical protein
MNDRKKDRREMALVESRIGEDGIDERLKLSGDEVIEFLNESSLSENKKTNSLFLKACRIKYAGASCADSKGSTSRHSLNHSPARQQLFYEELYLTCRALCSRNNRLDRDLFLVLPNMFICALKKVFMLYSKRA